MLNKYLERIKYDGTSEPNVENLYRLQYCHLHTIPYENFDIMRGVPFTLDIDSVLDKIITRRRGGYCFELNGAFAWLLRSLGYNITEYFARFLRGKDCDMPMRRHRVIRVDIGADSYICDVGVGGACPLFPLKLEADTEQHGSTYKLGRDSVFGWIIYEKLGNDWHEYYGFTEEPQYPIDFVTTDFYCQSSPDSFFRKSNMASIRTAGGRITIAGNELRFFSGDSVLTEVIDSDKRMADVLSEYFGIVL